MTIKFPTVAEVQKDYDATCRDLKRCETIVRNIELFVTDSHGDDRRAQKLDLIKWTVIRDAARRLKDQIEAKLKELKK